MSDVKTTVRPSPRPDPAVGEPTFITEQRVLFATAAVVAAPRVRPRRWTVVVRGVRAWAVGPRTPSQLHYPQRHRYLETALMAREMDRL